jgi:hypothetical protein
MMETTQANAEQTYRAALVTLAAQVAPSQRLYALLLDAERAYDLASAQTEGTVDYILNSPTLTAEYVVTRQKPEQIEAPEGATLPSGTRQLPSLQTFRFIAGGRIVPYSPAEFTFNVSATRFIDIPSGMQTKRFRDWQAALEIDVPLKQIQGVGKPALAFSGRYINLRAQPLGEKISVNGVEFDTRGNIWVAQARLTMRTDSGIQFPLSLTASNRSELLAHERDIRGSVGITFDLDKLFARAGQ